MKNKSSIIIPAALIFLSMFSCANDQETKQVPLQKFSVANPEVRDIVYRLEYPGYLQSERIVEIIARTEGFLIENKIKPGQKVRITGRPFVVARDNFVVTMIDEGANPSLITFRFLLDFETLLTLRIRDYTVSFAEKRSQSALPAKKKPYVVVVGSQKASP